MTATTRHVVAGLCVLLIAACTTPGGPTASPAALPTQAPTQAPSQPPSAPPTSQPADPTSSPVPRPSGALAWPLGDPVELSPGRYFSSPPFDVPFTFEVADTGWETGHLHGEFFDLFRFDAGPAPANPTRWIAFAHPATIRGAGALPASDLPAAGLTAQAAIDALVARDDVIDSNAGAQDLFGLAGARVDLQAERPSTPLFGGDDGTFGLDPALPARLVALPIDGGLLLVLALAPPDQLEAAWAQALEILETVELL